MHKRKWSEPSFGNNILSYIKDGKVKHDISSSYRIDRYKLINADKQIFIEFSYRGDDIDIFKGYENIHRTTRTIFKHIHSHLKEGKQLFIYKVFVEESGKINMKISKKASGMINGYSALAGFSEAKELQQSLIMVPETKHSFAMDEFLYLETTYGNIAIQIEHSEKLRFHKSNMIEFILRVANRGNYINLSKYAKLVNRSVGMKRLNELRNKYIEAERTRINDIVDVDYVQKCKEKYEEEEERVKRIFEDIASSIPSDEQTFNFIKQLGYEVSFPDNRLKLGYTSDNSNRDGSIHLSSPIVEANPTFAARYFHKFKL